MGRIRYAHSGGLNIAYEIASEGPRDILYVDGIVSHRDLEWEWWLTRGINERIASMGRAVFLDKRGTGLSDRDLGHGSLEDRMDDIRAVLDAAECERVTIIAVSEGGPLAMMFAATYPERVERLVLYATFCCSRKHDDYPWGATDEETAEAADLIEEHWGTGRVMAQLIGLEDEDLEFLGRYERSSASPSMVRRIIEANALIDARPILPAISVPTLIAHHNDDPNLPIDGTRWMADQIPGARLLEIPGRHGVHLSDDAELWDAVHEFITGEERPIEIDRVLATVLFTDIVGSTALAADLGDTQWRSVLERHDAVVERCVERHRGRIVKNTGDGVFAVFDGPARGIRCAKEVAEEVRPIGIEIRAGLHTGECEVRGDDYAGMTVHIGARVSALAGPGEVAVSSTVRDLVIGADLEFESENTTELKGVPGRWTILTVA